MKSESIRTIDGLILKLTCAACPEQYDVFDEDGKQVGYLRLRHGYFRVNYLWVGGEVIFVAHPRGDGIFEEDERDFYLNKAVKAIKARREKDHELSKGNHN